MSEVEEVIELVIYELEGGREHVTRELLILIGELALEATKM